MPVLHERLNPQRPQQELVQSQIDDELPSAYLPKSVLIQK